jgi:NADH-ubiquinone oxidoreductase chain 1
LLPVFIIFFIGSVAETNRAPFDLAEAESELVSGFMTEHAAVIFVFFFLAEYASIILICILNSILFLGGYLLDFTYVLHMFYALDNVFLISPHPMNIPESIFTITSYPLIEGMIYGLTIGIKSCIMVFVFI